MKELQKRIITSFLLIIVLYLAFINNLILTSVLLLITFVILEEFYKIFSQVFNKKKFIKLVLIFAALSYLTYFSLSIWLFLTSKIYENKILLLFILSICISTDIGGYVFGKIFKGKKITKISPNKTYSGMFGSFVLSLIISLVFFNYLNFSINIFVLTIIISISSQIGDLFISYLKRKAKIKDTGNFLPGHGGLLDRLDGILIAVPLGIILVSI